jgi:hypothetical protein
MNQVVSNCPVLHIIAAMPEIWLQGLILIEPSGRQRQRHILKITNLEAETNPAQKIDFRPGSTIA